MDLTHSGRRPGQVSGASLPRPLEAVRSWRAARVRRHDADRRIAAGFPVGPELAWRVDELTSYRERKLLARSLRDILDEVSRATLPGASPLNRVAVRPHVEELRALAERLSDVERPVRAAGILAVHRLLTDPDSPLYEAADSGCASETLAAVSASLEPR